MSRRSRSRPPAAPAARSSTTCASGPARRRRSRPPAERAAPDLLAWERAAVAAGHARVGGIDEAGRGPLAGPVVAACVVLPADLVREGAPAFRGLTDSKQLTPSQRDAFFERLHGAVGVEIGVGACSAEEIDRFNILRATHLAMARAVRALAGPPDFALVDGLPVPGLPCPSRALVGGDAASLAIAAASVIAKVTRDRWMVAADTTHPGYGFAQHKGYGTAAHLRALAERGPCLLHRRTFAPVAARGVAAPAQGELFPHRFPHAPAGPPRREGPP